MFSDRKKNAGAAEREDCKIPLSILSPLGHKMVNLALWYRKGKLYVYPVSARHWQPLRLRG